MLVYLISGIEKTVNILERNDFKLIETHSENALGNSMADMIFKNKALNSTIIFYHNTDCFSENWCNTLDFYTSSEIYESIKKDLLKNSWKQIKNKYISNLGVSEEYVYGNENTYPYKKLILTKLGSESKHDYLISISNNSSYSSNTSKMKFRKRYKEYE